MQGSRLVDSRNYGIDLLRMIAMMGVVINHLIMQGGVLNASTNTSKTAIIWFIEIIAYLAVDCYVLISGYVNYSDTYKGYKFNRIIDLWLQVVVWGIVLYLIPMFGMNETYQLKDIFRILFPVTFNQYWFFTAYFALWFVMPVLNSLCMAVKEEQAKVITVVCAVVFSIYATVIAPIGDVFGMAGGFSFIWFCILYVIGAFMKKYRLFYMRKSNLVIGLALGIGVTWFCICFLGKITKMIIGREFGESILVSYNSPTILVASICLVVYFSTLRLEKYKKTIKFWASATFGVYIIHMHPWVKNHILLDNFKFVSDETIWLIPIEIIGFGLIITVICLILDKGREFIFKLLKINVLEMRINNVLNQGLKWLQRKEWKQVVK